MRNTVGRKPDIVAEAWTLRFSLTTKQHGQLTESIMAQLSFCRSDDARRIILGISK